VIVNGFPFSLRFLDFFSNVFPVGRPAVLPEVRTIYFSGAAFFPFAKKVELRLTSLFGSALRSLLLFLILLAI